MNQNRNGMTGKITMSMTRTGLYSIGNYRRRFEMGRDTITIIVKPNYSVMGETPTWYVMDVDPFDSSTWPKNHSTYGDYWNDPRYNGDPKAFADLLNEEN
jgi:hypothetical protein